MFKTKYRILGTLRPDQTIRVVGQYKKFLIWRDIPDTKGSLNNINAITYVVIKFADALEGRVVKPDEIDIKIKDKR